MEEYQEILSSPHLGSISEFSDFILQRVQFSPQRGLPITVVSEEAAVHTLFQRTLGQGRLFPRNEGPEDCHFSFPKDIF